MKIFSASSSLSFQNSIYSLALSTRISLLLILVCTLLYTQAASAEIKWRNVFIVPSASIGYSTFSFPKKLDQKITFTNGEAAFTAVYKKWLISTNVSGSLLNENISEEDDEGIAKRRDIDILSGYQAYKNLSLFLGYKYGRTNISFTNRDTNQKTEDFYRQIGPYAGASYTYSFQKAGKVSLSLAYSRLDALNALSANIEKPSPENTNTLKNCNFETNPKACDLDDFNGVSNGATQGLSAGISWNIAITPRLLYRTKFKFNRYQQTISYKGQTRDGSETFTVLMMGLAYVI